MTAQGDEDLMRKNLAERGWTKEFILENLRMEKHMELIFLDEFPLTLEDAEEEFNKNVEGNQAMFKGYAPPEKAENPDTITFEDVSEPFFENFKRRKMTADGPKLLEEIIQKYENQDLVKNYIDEETFKGVTKIEQQVHEVDPTELKRAPAKHPEKQHEEVKDDEHQETAEPEGETEHEEGIADDHSEEEEAKGDHPEEEVEDNSSQHEQEEETEEH